MNNEFKQVAERRENNERKEPLNASEKTQDRARKELNRVNGFESILAIANGQRIAEFKFRWTDNRNGSVCHCVAIINNQPLGYGKAGGYGYDKQSSALENAFDSLGFKDFRVNDSRLGIEQALTDLGFKDFELFKVWF